METGEPLHNYSNSMKKKKTTKSDSDESEPSVSSEADKQGTEETQENDESIDSDKQPSVRVRQPCIMIFDSLGGDSRARVYSTLREYLRIEYKVNYVPLRITFSQNSLQLCVVFCRLEKESRGSLQRRICLDLCPKFPSSRIRLTAASTHYSLWSASSSIQYCRTMDNGAEW